MSAEKIQDLDTRTTRLEVISEGVLKAVEKQTDSTEKLTKSVTEMTTKLSVVIEDNKDLKSRYDLIETRLSNAETDIKIINRGNRWQGWVAKAIVTIVVGAIALSIGINR